MINSCLNVNGIYWSKLVILFAKFDYRWKIVNSYILIFIVYCIVVTFDHVTGQRG